MKVFLTVSAFNLYWNCVPSIPSRFSWLADDAKSIVLTGNTKSCACLWSSVGRLGGRRRGGESANNVSWLRLHFSLKTKLRLKGTFLAQQYFQIDDISFGGYLHSCSMDHIAQSLLVKDSWSILGFRA
jgi:hypothetical protein